jgi:hypothetical protein
MGLNRVLKANHFEIDVRRGKVWKRFGLQFKTANEAIAAAHGTGWNIRLVSVCGPTRTVMAIPFPGERKDG